MGNIEVTNGFAYAFLGILFIIVIIFASYFAFKNVYVIAHERPFDAKYQCQNQTIVSVTRETTLNSNEQCKELCKQRINATEFIIQTYCKKQQTLDEKFALPDEPICVCKQSVWDYAIAPHMRVR
jgi:hypothetical protein